MGIIGALKSGASWVGNQATNAYEGAKDGAEWVGDKATDVYEEGKDGVDWAAGKGEDAYDWSKDKAERAWSWTRHESPRWKDAGISIFHGIKDGGEAALHDVGEGAFHLNNGLFRLASGDFKGGGKELGGGLAQATAGSVFDGGALALAGGVSAVQVVTHVEAVGRALSPEETELLRKVYGNSIDYSAVRIKEGSAGLLTAADRPWTSGDTIYMNKDRTDSSWNRTLVHEMAHVWQFQNGGADYQGKSVSAQYITHDAYDWEAAALQEKPWDSLNPEDQAELIEMMYDQGFFDSGSFRFTPEGGAKAVDRTAYAQAVIEQVRSGRGAP